MKPILLGIVAIGVVGGITYFVPNDYSVQNVQPETITKEVEVTPDWAADEEAVQAAKDVIRRKELEAQESDLVEQIAALQDELDTVRKELGTY